jgi:hypothetical protein
MTEKYSVQTLRDYLLGQLPEPEAERLDELSIADDECADRITAAEHDLVDAFARGELQGIELERFRSRYLTTPAGHEAVRFARALQSLDENPVPAIASAAGPGPPPFVNGRSRLRERLALAAVVVILAGASGWLVLENRTLRGRLTSAESSRDELQRAREAEARPPAETAPRPLGPSSPPPTLATLVLAPQLRSTGQLPTVAMTGGTSELPVRLDLEPVDYPSYAAVLATSTGDRQLWRADGLIARTAGGRQTLGLRLPAAVLSPQVYLIRLSGVPSRGAPEVVGEYRFAVVR